MTGPGWTDGPGVATCQECGTPFVGLVCPTCRQFVEPHEVGQIVTIRPGGDAVVIAEHTPDPVLEALLDDSEVA